MVAVKRQSVLFPALVLQCHCMACMSCANAQCQLSGVNAFGCIRSPLLHYLTGTSLCARICWPCGIFSYASFSAACCCPSITVVQAGVTDELIQQALKQNSTNRARRLFHPLPYTQQEHMAANGTDVAAVVEIMCGKVSPAAPSAITGTVGLNDPSLYWQPRQALQQQQPLLLLYPQPGQQQQQSHAESIGQISSCILMKLIVDLWLSAGTVAAFPLVQRMLQQALYQSQAEYRAMAFDIIYNLSLHGTMLLGTQASGSGSPVLQTDLTAQNGIAVAGTQLQQGGLQQQQQQYQYQQDLQQLARLQQLNTTQGRYELSNSVAGAGGGGGGRAQGSPTGSVASGDEAQSNSRASLDSRQGSAGARSSHSSPRIHLPPQLLAPQKPPQQQQPSVVSQLSSSSPVASPKGRSRLSRSDLRITAEQQEQRRSSTSSFRGSSAGVAAADAERTGASTRVGADRLDTTVEAAVEAGEHEAADRRGEVPMEVSWESWLQQLLYELLLMLAMVRGLRVVGYEEYKVVCCAVSASCLAVGRFACAGLHC